MPATCYPPLRASPFVCKPRARLKFCLRPYGGGPTVLSDSPRPNKSGRLPPAGRQGGPHGPHLGHSRYRFPSPVRATGGPRSIPHPPRGIMPVMEHPLAGPAAVSPAGAGRHPLAPRLGSQQLAGWPLFCTRGSPGRLGRKPLSCSCHRLLWDLGPRRGGLGGREPRAAMGRGAGLDLEAADNAAPVDAGARPGPGQAAQHTPPG